MQKIIIMMKKIFLSILTVFLVLGVNAQTVYTMQNDSVTLDCNIGGVLHDSGGSGASYANNESFFFTVCPNSPTEAIGFDFNSAAFGDGDYVCVFDGTDNFAPLMDCYNNVNPITLNQVTRATVSNTSRCLTFQFYSDAATVGDFEIELFCLVPCQEIVSEISMTDPAINILDSVYLDLCFDDTLVLGATGAYTQNDTYYHQSDAGSNFYWEVGAIKDTGQVTTQFLVDEGFYEVKLTIEDSIGCFSVNEHNLNVRYIPQPSFSPLYDSIICYGETVVFYDVVAGENIGGNVIIGDTVRTSSIFTVTSAAQYIPDDADGVSGNGISTPATYSVNVTGFIPGSIITSGTQVEQICLDIEHSFAGDIDIVLVAPNGSQIHLVDMNPPAGPSASYGTPIFGVNPLTPGTPETYCWSPTGTSVPIISGAAYPAMIPPFPATYQASGNWNNFIGSPVNGIWTIQVFDDYGGDDGFIFGASFAFDSAFIPPPDSFYVAYDAIGVWDFDPFITSDSLNRNSIDYFAGSIGANNLVYTTTSNFGCFEADTLNFWVDSFEVVATPSDTSVCAFDPVQLNTVVNGSTGALTYGWTPTTDLNLSNIANPISTLTSGSIQYTVGVTNANACTFYDTIDVQIESSFEFNAMGDTAICFGDSIQLWASGGATYYDWIPNNGTISDTASATPVVSPTTTTTYTVQADSTGCSQYANITVSVSNISVFALPPTNPACGLTNGSIIQIGSGGVGPLSYSNGDTVQANGVFSNLDAGVYPIVISDGSSCDYNDTVTLTGGAPLVIDTVIITNPGCGTVGSIDVVLTNPLLAVTYTLDVGPVSQDSSLFLGLNGGTYIITIDDGVCPAIDTTIVLTGAGAVVLAVDSTLDISCFNQADGEINLSATGGTTYDFSIDGINYFPSGSFTNLYAGIYTVYTRESGCIDSSFVTLIQPDSLTFTTVIDSILCFGQNSNIAITAAGGTIPYSYSMDGIPTFTALSTNIVSGGNYAIQVMDANNCLSVIELDTIVEPANLVLTLDSTQSANCAALNGAVFTSIAGGVGPYNFSINSGATTQGSSSFLNLASSIYTVTVVDANSCPAAVVANVQANASVVLSVAFFDSVSCFGMNDASVQLSTLNGTQPFSFSLDNGPVQLDSLFSNLSGGLHGFNVIDYNGCEDSVTIFIVEPTDLLTSFTTDTLSCNEAGDGEIHLNVTGGSLPYTYAVDNFFAPQLLGDFTGLDAGLHIAYFADANGCLDTISSINIVEPDTFIITGVAVQNILCSGSSNGSFTVSVSGGTNNYQYNLNSGTNQSSNVFNNLTQGIYTINAIDTNGCSASVIDSISVPNALDLTLDSVINANCSLADGAIYLNISGGVGPYDYTLDAGVSFQDSTNFINVFSNTYFIEVTDDNSCTDTLTVVVQDDATLALSIASFDSVSCFASDDASVQLSATGGNGPYTFNVDNGLFQPDSLFENLAGGSHTFIVEDANGCAEPVSIVIYEPTELIAGFIADSLTCDDSGNGEIQLSAVDGTTPYTYAIDNYFAPQLSNDFLNLDAGIYVGYVIDANNCSDTIDIINVYQPDTFVITNINKQDLECNGDNDGMFTVSVSGGTSSFLYNLNGGTNQPSNVFNTLGGGVYTINASDANGCMATVVDSIFDPTAIVLVQDSLKDVTCFNGNDGYLSYTVSGGLGPYTYSNDNGVSFQSSNVFGSLTAGTYDIVVKDFNGCTASLNPLISQATQIQITTSSTPVTCAGSTDAIIFINTVSGGNPPYSAIVNSNPPVSFTGNYSLGNLQGGVSHTVQVVDAAGCTSIVQNVFINEPDSLMIVQENIYDVSCSNNGDGSVSLLAQHGTPSYTFTLDVNGTILTQSGSDSVFFDNLNGGLYPATLTDANGCTVSTTVNLLEPNALVIDSLQILSQITCFGDDNGSILVHASGGSQFASPSAPYTYLWSPSGNTDHKAGPLGPGVHEVTITDANGCTATASETILAVDPVIANINPDSAFMSMGDTLQLGVNVQNAIGNNLQYSWAPTNGLSCSDCANPSVTIYNDISYSVVVTDSNGCTNYNYTEVFITIDASLFFFIPNGFTPNDDGMNDVFEVYGQDIKTVDMMVFNRWGEKVFQGSNQFETWDGTFKGVKQGSGVYSYAIDVTFLNDAQLNKKGSVSLIR